MKRRSVPMFTTARFRARRRARRTVLRVIGAVGVVTVLFLSLVVLVDGRASPALAVSGPAADGDQPGRHVDGATPAAEAAIPTPPRRATSIYPPPRCPYLLPGAGPRDTASPEAAPILEASRTGDEVSIAPWTRS